MFFSLSKPSVRPTYSKSPIFFSCSVIDSTQGGPKVSLQSDTLWAHTSRSSMTCKYYGTLESL